MQLRQHRPPNRASPPAPRSFRRAHPHPPAPPAQGKRRSVLRCDEMPFLLDPFADPMSLLHPVLQNLYASVRRLAIIDVKRLMYLPPAAAQAPLPLAEGYRLSMLEPHQLRAQLQLQQAPDHLLSSPPAGAPGPAAPTADAPPAEASSGAEGRQSVVAAWQATQLVAYVHLAQSWVPAAENFSRSRHLGTSLRLPAGTFFAHTAYTFAPHRGRRLLGSMISYFAESQRDQSKAAAAAAGPPCLSPWTGPTRPRGGRSRDWALNPWGWSGGSAAGRCRPASTRRPPRLWGFASPTMLADVARLG